MMVTEDLHTLKFSMEDTIGHLLLNQPPSNRMSALFFHELHHVVELLKDLSDMKALVISGAGRHFSSGADPDELMEMLANSDEQTGNLFFEENIGSFEYFEKANIPVISAIRGVCIGSAMELALFSHFRFCGEDAVFGLPESSFGIIPGIGGISHMIEMSGKAQAIGLLLHGNMFPAAEALDYGLVDRVLPRKEVLPYAFSFAEKISKNYHKGKKILYLKRTYEN